MKIKIKESIIRENDYSETDEFTLIKEMNHWIKQLKNFFVDDSKAQKAIADYFYHDDGKHQEDFRELQASVKALHKLWLKLDKITEDVEDKENMKESVYTDAGFNSRKDYLKSLASDFGVDINTVYDLASILGPDEDFDALVTELEDMADDYTGEDNTTFLKELDYALKHYNYVVYDNASDEFDWWIGHFDDYESAADNVITNLCRYNMDCVLCDTNKHLRTIYNADKLDASVLNTGKANMNYYDMSYFTDDVENFIDPYLVGEDTAIENIRDILDMCEVKTEKY